MMPRWPRTIEKSAGWRTSSMALNSITSRGASMRRPTCLQKRHPAKSRCQRASSPMTNTSPQSATRGQNRPMTVPPIQPQGLTNRRLHLASKSWSSKKTQRQSSNLWSTGEYSTLTTSSVTRYRWTRWKLDGSHVALSTLFLWGANSTSEATLGSYNAASPSNRGSAC